MTEIPSDLVTIISKRFLSPLKLSIHPDKIGDRKAWLGTTDSDNNVPICQWRFFKKNIPTDGDCYFIVNEQYQQPLTLGVDKDSDNDRVAWGAGIENFVGTYVNNPTPIERKYYWKLLPVKSKYKIINCEYGSFLKPSLNKDNLGDRLVYGHKPPGTDVEANDLYLWDIEEC